MAGVNQPIQYKVKHLINESHAFKRIIDENKGVTSAINGKVNIIMQKWERDHFEYLISIKFHGAISYHYCGKRLGGNQNGHSTGYEQRFLKYFNLRNSFLKSILEIPTPLLGKPIHLQRTAQKTIFQY